MVGDRAIRGYTDCVRPPIAPDFYLQPTVDVARSLLGAVLVRRLPITHSEDVPGRPPAAALSLQPFPSGQSPQGVPSYPTAGESEARAGVGLTGIIVETEAYLTGDPASHAYRGRTDRNAAMFGPPGSVYVYRSYGIHQMLNIVTGPEGLGEAVLIRAVEPLSGIETMRLNRGGISNDYELTNGPGKLAAAFAITRLEHNGIDVTDPHSPLIIIPGEPPGEIVTTTRVGISVGVDQPWRFIIKGNRYVSKGRPSGGR